MKIPRPAAATEGCIFCRIRGQRLTDEHIVPFAFNGALIFEAATCERCRGITAKFEQIVARDMYLPLRARFGMKTRRPKERPSHFSLEVRGPLGSRMVNVPAKLHPRMYAVLKLPLPGLLEGRPRVDADLDCVLLNIEVRENANDTKALVEHGVMREDESIAISNVVHWGAFSRFLAKVAHTFAASHIGLDLFEPVLPDIILGRDTTISHFIGGYSQEPVERYVPAWLDIIQVGSEHYLRCSVFLVLNFDHRGLPVYQVIVGRVPNVPALLARAGEQA